VMTFSHPSVTATTRDDIQSP